jgi:tripartite-type tricarboxylate transporter receptor subunit TctC
MKACAKAIFAILVFAWAVSACAQYPIDPVRLIVPFPPGGSFDVLGRQVAQQLSKKWNQPVIVVNTSGAGGNIGARAVASAAPDGYTLLFWGDGLITNPLLYENPPFLATRDFSGVSLIASSPQVLVTSSKSALATLKDVLASTRELTYGTAGSGTPGHLAGELMKRKGPAKLQHVPYRGGSPALVDLMGGQIDLVYTGLPACIGYIKSGSIKALSVSSKQRSAVLPDVPSISEVIPGYDVDTWYGILAPKATPLKIREKIATDVKEALTDVAFRKRLVDDGFVPVGSTPVELDAKLVEDTPGWQQMVKESGARAE